ncbi:MAG: cytochrome c [Pseudomonadota bacterium]
MNSRISFRILLAPALIASVAACSGTDADPPEEAVVEGEATEAGDVSAVEARQENYEAIGDAFKAIRGQLEGDSPDFALIQTSAEEIGAKMEANRTLFPEGTGVGSGADTEALDVIWEDMGGFTDALDNNIAAATALAEAGGAADLAAVQEGVKNLGATCKACHDKYRLDDD